RGGGEGTQNFGGTCDIESPNRKREIKSPRIKIPGKSRGVAQDDIHTDLGLFELLRNPPGYITVRLPVLGQGQKFKGRGAPRLLLRAGKIRGNERKLAIPRKPRRDQTRHAALAVLEKSGEQVAIQPVEDCAAEIRITQWFSPGIEKQQARRPERIHLDF